MSPVALARRSTLVLALLFLPGSAAPARAAATSASPAPARLLPPYRPAENEPARSAEDRRFDRVINEWFAGELANRPSWATGVGIHAYDARLEATSRAAVRARLARANQFLGRAQGIAAERLTANRRLDREIFLAKLRGVGLELETIRSWERNPSSYAGVVSSGMYSLVKRDFAPIDTRLASINARLAEVPRVFADARLNLRNPPKIYTEIALGQAQGLVSFLKNLLPMAVADAGSPALRATFERRNTAAIAEVERYAKWLETDLMPRSNGDFRIGKAAYQEKLADDEMVSESVDTLLARGYAALADNHRRMVKVARRIDPSKTPEQVLAEMATHHPSEDSLLIVARAGLDKIRSFIADKKILTPPVNQNLNVIETPIFNRSLSFASMDSPGVFEQNANEAYYNITPVDSSWSADKKAEHLGFFNPWQLEIVSIHEAFPGHYYQFMHLKHVPSLVRTLMGSGSNSEGWAHYCEEMAIEQGYGGGDPRYEMAMLNLALQRIGRYIVGIEMHCNGWTQDLGTEFFQKEAYMARVNAEREARRGTSDPTYLVYTLGKWEIQKLRGEVQARMGDRFVLGDFHDHLLDLGRAPLSEIRKAFLDPGYGLMSVSGAEAGSDIAK
ncbi:MAG: DUF885 domain-containing protein [Candidatus Eisenbacteria bacterium]